MSMHWTPPKLEHDLNRLPAGTRVTISARCLCGAWLGEQTGVIPETGDFRVSFAVPGRECLVVEGIPHWPVLTARWAHTVVSRWERAHP